MVDATREITVFISSPGDVEAERKATMAVIERLNERTRVGQRFRLRALDYKRTTPAVVGESAQTVVDRYMAKASESDIFVCILWSRMGTPVLDEASGEQFESGTHYEFRRAYDAFRKDGRPRLLLYRCRRSLPNDVDLKQVEKVRAFFDRFTGTDPNLLGMIKSFEKVSELESTVFDDLDAVLSRDFATADDADRRGAVRLAEDDTVARRRYLEILSRDVENRLKTSIHSARLLDLAADENLDSTTLPWEFQAKDDGYSYESFTEMFTAFRGSFLLLGGPGSGKTTTLLCIARQLLAQAHADPVAPVPLLFNLSKFSTFARSPDRRRLSLREKKRDDEKDVPDFKEWLTSLLVETYRFISSDIAHAWIHRERVALLLDGLDEVDDEWLERLAVSLNQTYLSSHPDSVVVICSRIVEYDPLKRKEETRLSLRGAATLKPLNRAQIDNYLESMGAAGVKAALTTDAALEELAQVPLILSMMTLAYAGLPPTSIPTELPLVDRRRHLFDAYVDRMMQRKARRDAGVPFDLRPERDQPTAYTRQAINTHLGWLAVRLSERRQTVFPSLQLYGFLGYDRRSVRVPEGLYLALCAAIAVVAMVPAGLSWAWAATLITCAAFSPLLFTEPSQRYVKVAWTAVGTMGVTTLLIGGFGLLNASILTLLPVSPSPYLSGLALLSTLTAAVIGLVLAADHAIRRLRGHLAISLAMPLLVMAALWWNRWSWTAVAWTVAGVFASVQLIQMWRLIREEVSKRSEILLAVTVTAGILAVSAFAVWLVKSPAVKHVAVTIVLALAMLAADAFKPTALIVTAVGSALGALLWGAPGAALSAFASLLIVAKLPVTATDAFFRRRVLDSLVRLRVVTRKIPPGLDDLLEHSVDALLLKMVGQEYEFVHRLLRDHFATRELTPALHGGGLPEQLRAIDHLSRQGEAAIEALVALMGRPVVDIRVGAAAALARIAAPAVEPHLKAAMADSSAAVRRSLVTAIAGRRSRKTVEVILTAAVRDRDAAVRDVAIRAVRKLDGYRQGRILGHALAGESAEVDRQVLLLWPDHASLEEVPKRLFDYLQDADARIRLAAVTACGHHCQDAPRDVVRNLLFDPDIAVREKFMSVAVLGARNFATELLALYREPLKGVGRGQTFRTWWWRGRSVSAHIAAMAIRHMHGGDDPAVAIAIAGALKDRRAIVRAAAASALPWQRTGDAATQLTPLLDDRNGEVRAAAIEGLDWSDSETPPNSKIHELFRRDRVSEVRQAAARFLGKRTYAPALPDLVRALQDSEFALRWQARSAIRQFGEPGIAALRSFVTRTTVKMSLRIEVAEQLVSEGDEQVFAAVQTLEYENDIDSESRQRIARLLEKRGTPLDRRLPGESGPSATSDVPEQPAS